MQILMNTKVFKKKGNTKTVYIMVDEYNDKVAPEHYNNWTNPQYIRDWKKLGYSYTTVKNYTCQGYKVTQITAFDPKKTTKFVTTFKFN